jgi:hypothetical protein
MTPAQRQLIKEAYQEGYYQALDENVLKGILAAIKGLFRGGKSASKTASKAPKKGTGIFKGKRRGIIRIGDGSPFPGSNDLDLLIQWISNNRLHTLTPAQQEDYFRLIASYRNGNIDDNILIFALRVFFPDLPIKRKPPGGSGGIQFGDPDIPGIDPDSGFGNPDIPGIDL